MINPQDLTFPCDLCMGEVVAEKYGQGYCSNCGSFYYYDEGLTLQLLGPQIACLLKYREEWEKDIKEETKSVNE